MKKQDYHHHLMFYTPHHFIFYPVIGILAVIAGYCAYHYADSRLAFVLLAIAFIMLGWLSYMLRQHYALTNQNRTVRLEMRLRYYQLTGIRLEAYEDKLSFGQIAALRFASDEELPVLLQRTVNEGLTPDAIKKSVKNWYPDHMRV